MIQQHSRRNGERKKNDSKRKRRQKLAYTFRVNGRVVIYSHLCGLNAISDLYYFTGKIMMAFVETFFIILASISF